MTHRQNQKWIVVGICVYLTLAYVFFGLVCYLAWRRSVVFNWVGWTWDNPLSEVLRRVIFAWCAGGLGSISYSLWKLFRYYCELKDFDTAWTIWYIFGPVSGSLLGIATYSLVVGGLLVLGENTTLRSNWAIFMLAFLAGFSAKRVLRKIHAIAGQLFQENAAQTQTSTPS